MLSDETQEKLAEAIVDRIEELNTFIIIEIGKSLVKFNNLNISQANQLAQILRYGGSYRKIIKKLEQTTKLSIKQIEEIMEETAKKNQLFSEKFYRYKNIDFIPFEENIALQQEVKIMTKKVIDNYLALISTSAFLINYKGQKVYTPLNQIYNESITTAVLSIAQGKQAYNVSIRNVMKQLSASGIKTVDYASGYSRRLDSAVRTNVLDGMRDLSNKIQEDFGKEYGADGIEISVHLNPAPDHAKIQGKQYSTEDFKKLNDSLKRPISTLNCYHYIFSIILGVNKPLYSDKQLKEILKKNDDGFIFEGKHYTNYQGTQLQRRIETAIRKQKDFQIASKSINDNKGILKAQKKIRQLTQKYNQLSKASGLPTKKQRLIVYGYTKVKDLDK